MFPDAPEPFIDLSTGINPHPYPLPALAAGYFRAPAGSRQRPAARSDRGAAPTARPSADHVVPAPGTQILLPQVAALVPPGRAAMLAPTYAEHARAARLRGTASRRSPTPMELRGARSRDRRQSEQSRRPHRSESHVAGLADELRPRGGLLMVDEAFMDVAPDGASLSGDVERGNIVVLRSFGKFFGLAGLRLGFALAAPSLVNRLDRSLGPWAVAGPAILVGETALADETWQRRTLASLARLPNGSTSCSPGQVLKTSAAHRFTGSRDPPARMDCSIISGARAFWSGALRRIRAGCDGGFLTVRQIGSD